MYARQLERLGLPTPSTRSRHRSIGTDKPTPMDLTAKLFGDLPAVPLDLGVEESVRWLDDRASPSVKDWLEGVGAR